MVPVANEEAFLNTSTVAMMVFQLRVVTGTPKIPSRGLALNHATGCRVDAETVPMRAYVTGGWLRQLRRALQTRCMCATPHTA
jgi:hypothetical protein